MFVSVGLKGRPGQTMLVRMMQRQVPVCLGDRVKDACEQIDEDERWRSSSPAA